MSPSELGMLMVFWSEKNGTGFPEFSGQQLYHQQFNGPLLYNSWEYGWGEMFTLHIIVRPKYTKYWWHLEHFRILILCQMPFTSLAYSFYYLFHVIVSRRAGIHSELHTPFFLLHSILFNIPLELDSFLFAVAIAFETFPLSTGSSMFPAISFILIAE